MNTECTDYVKSLLISLAYKISHIFLIPIYSVLLCVLYDDVEYTSNYVDLKCVDLGNSYSKPSLRILYPNATVIDEDLVAMITS